MWRALAWLIVGIIAVNFVALLSPRHVLVGTTVESYVVDHDLVYDAPQAASSPLAGNLNRQRKICVYWGGGAKVRPTFVAVEHKCGLFRAKQGSARLIDE